MINSSDKIGWHTEWTITKFSDPHGNISALSREGVSLDQIKEMYPKAFLGVDVVHGNIALNTGLQTLAILGFGVTGSGTMWNNANASIGVGDSATAEAATQTNLVAATNKLYKGMDSTYPTRTNQTVTWQATFASADANYSWQEFVVNNAVAGSGVTLNRKVADKGTKASGETWVVQVAITLS